MLSLLLFTASPALAQDLYSVSGMLDALNRAVSQLEENQIQITDITAALVWDDGRGADIPVSLGGGDLITLVGLADEARILDLDMSVSDPYGNVICEDTEADPIPVCTIEAVEAGDYEINLRTVEPQPGWSVGYYFFLAGAARSGAPISIAGSTENLHLLTQVLEEEGYQILHAEWEVIQDRRNAIVEVQLPTGDWQGCRAVAMGDPDRTRKIGLRAMDHSGNEIGALNQKKWLAFADFEGPSAFGKHYFLIEDARLKGYKDAFATLVVGCMP